MPPLTLWHSCVVIKSTYCSKSIWTHNLTIHVSNNYHQDHCHKCSRTFWHSLENSFKYSSNLEYNILKHLGILLRALQIQAYIILLKPIQLNTSLTLLTYSYLLYNFPFYNIFPFYGILSLLISPSILTIWAMLPFSHLSFQV